LRKVCQGPVAATQGVLVSTLDDLNVDLTVLLGQSRMPVHMLLRMGRGAVIELQATETDMVDILANGHPIARGQIVVTGTRISVEITQLIKKPSVVREPGLTIGDGLVALQAAVEEPAPPSAPAKSAARSADL
jgi:flagellar motor switch protein FliN